jgi:hypothetical protein
MSSLSKMAVQLALEAAAGERADFLVFASQHGELARTVELLRSIVAGSELSPAGFSQSVHNTSSGLYTIIAGSTAPATSVAAGAGTFAYAWLEAEAYLLANPGNAVLLVSYDEALPPDYGAYTRHVQRTFAVALLLRNAASGITLRSTEAEAEEWLPTAPLFMEWALANAPALRVTAGGQGWEWRRPSP